jgi:hypothetical protein
MADNVIKMADKYLKNSGECSEGDCKDILMLSQALLEAVEELRFYAGTSADARALLEKLEKGE